MLICTISVTNNLNKIKQLQFIAAKLKTVENNMLKILDVSAASILLFLLNAYSNRVIIKNKKIKKIHFCYLLADAQPESIIAAAVDTTETPEAEAATERRTPRGDGRIKTNWSTKHRTPAWTDDGGGENTSVFRASWKRRGTAAKAHETSPVNAPRGFSTPCTARTPCAAATTQQPPAEQPPPRTRSAARLFPAAI